MLLVLGRLPSHLHPARPLERRLLGALVHYRVLDQVTAGVGVQEYVGGPDLVHRPDASDGPFGAGLVLHLKLAKLLGIAEVQQVELACCYIECFYIIYRKSSTKINSLNLLMMIF